jgi:hypothetical protein
VLVLLTVTTDWITAAGAIVAALAAIAGLAYAGRQLADANKTARGQFLLSIEDQLRNHADIHEKLFPPSGAWLQPGAGPATPEEWAAVAGYLGLFERMNVLRQNGSLSLDEIHDFYRYRIGNLWANARITGKIAQASAGWRQLIDLSADLGIPAAVQLRDPSPPKRPP